MQQLRESKTSVIVVDGSRVRQEKTVVGHLRGSEGAFKSFNPLETSTGSLFAVFHLEEHFWERKRRKKHDKTNTPKHWWWAMAEGTDSVTGGLAHARSH